MNVGLKLRGNVWWVRFTDHRKVRREMRGSRLKGAARDLDTNLRNLCEYAGCGASLPQDIADWITTKLDDDRKAQLLAWGMITQQQLVSGLPLADHITAWEGYLRHHAGDSHVRHQLHRLREIIATIDAKGFNDLSGDRVADAVGKLDKSQQTRNYYLRAVKQFGRWMVLHDRAAKMPAGLTALKQTEVTVKAVNRRGLTAEESDRLMAPEVPIGRRVSYALGLHAGLRRTQVKRLVVDDIDLDGETIRVPITGKSKKQRYVHINETLRAVLIDAIAGKKPTDPVGQVSLTIVAWIRKEAKADDIDFHTLRHTFITNLVAQGIHPAVVQKAAGHSTITLTMSYYTHIQPRDIVNGVRSLDKKKPNIKAG